MPSSLIDLNDIVAFIAVHIRTTVVMVGLLSPNTLIGLRFSCEMPETYLLKANWTREWYMQNLHTPLGIGSRGADHIGGVRVVE